MMIRGWRFRTFSKDVMSALVGSLLSSWLLIIAPIPRSMKRPSAWGLGAGIGAHVVFDLVDMEPRTMMQRRLGLAVASAVIAGHSTRNDNERHNQQHSMQQMHARQPARQVGI